MKDLARALFSFLIILLSACQTAEGFLIMEQPYSLNEIRKAVGAIAGKPRDVSPNQREIISAYFGRKQGVAFDPNSAKERLYAHFWILGDRRPYDIRVQVISERKANVGYSEVGEDIGLSKKVAEELSERLAKGQGGSNVIDTFRPF